MNSTEFCATSQSSQTIGHDGSSCGNSAWTSVTTVFSPTKRSSLCSSTITAAMAQQIKPVVPTSFHLNLGSRNATNGSPHRAQNSTRLHSHRRPCTRHSMRLCWQPLPHVRRRPLQCNGSFLWLTNLLRSPFVTRNVNEWKITQCFVSKNEKEMLSNTHSQMKRHEHKETNGVPANENKPTAQRQPKEKTTAQRQTKRSQWRNDNQKEINVTMTNEKNSTAQRHAKEPSHAITNQKKPTTQRKTKRNQWCNDKHEETNGATTN